MVTSRHKRDESGFALAEMIVTVSILGLAFTALLGGMFTSIRGSDYHQKQADVELAIATSVEWVKKRPYVPCEAVSPATYTPAAGDVTLPKGVSVATVANLKCWNIATETFDDWSPGKPDGGMQQVTISVTSSDAEQRAKSAITIVKRR